MTHLAEGFSWRDRAQAASNRGDRDAELTALRRCVAHLSLVQDDDEAVALPARAEASRRLADSLAEEGMWPEAMQAYQEATDSYGRMPGFEAQASECARRIREGVRALRFRPRDRLLLLTARYERELQSLRAQPSTETAQANCVAHIAGILHRCGRFNEAAARYRAALDLYAGAEDTELEQARTAMRLGDLYFGPLEDEVKAFSWYRRAEREFSLVEALDEAGQTARQECSRKLHALGTDLSDLTR